MRYNEMYIPPRDPSRRLDEAPRQSKGGNQNLFTGWQGKPTGYYPDFNDDRQGCFYPDADGYPTNLVVDPNGTPGGRTVPFGFGSDFDAVDQHPMGHVTATWTPDPYGNGRFDGTVDPLVDGPPRPEFFNVSLHHHRESGASRTRFMDVPDGRRFNPLGSQDGAATTYYVDAGLSLAPYAPDPNTGIQPDSYRQIPPGPAHGWSETPVVNVGRQDVDKLRLLKQQKNVKQNRLANSTYAGQTYSQSTAHVANPAGGASVPSWRSRG